jgi:uncharacterized protein (UPF0261 family)
MAKVVLMSSLDTRHQEALYARECIERLGCGVVLLDLSMGAYRECGADYTCIDVAREAGVPFETIAKTRGTAENAKTMVLGATRIVRDLARQGTINAIAGLGGASNTSSFSLIMKSLPFGFPKLILSSSAAMPAYAGAYYGFRDIAIFHSCVDLNGLNPFVKDVIGRFAGMIAGVAGLESKEVRAGTQAVALTEFQFVEACTRKVIGMLEAKGVEVIPFHAQGVGDRIMEEMVGDGLFRGVLDLVPAGLSEAIFGGNRAAGPDRLDKEMASGLPVVFTPCGFDLLSCGPYERRFSDALWRRMELEKRKLYIQDELRVQARISAEEMEVIGRIFSEKANRTRGKAAVFVPLKGFSALGTEGGVLHDPESDMALVRSLREHLDKAKVELVEMDCAYSDDVFAQAVSNRFLEMLEATGTGEVGRPADSRDHQHGGEAA